MSDIQNNIHKLRTALGLSQRALAVAVGTSQQQIQRVESGVQKARLDLAVKIAEALNSNLQQVFPNLSLPASVKNRKIKKEEAESVIEKAFAKAGIDPDVRYWTVKIGFVDGRSFFYPVAADEKERISSIVWNSTFDFIVFDTRTKRVAINGSKIGYCHFLFDLGVLEEDEEECNECKVVVNFIGSQSPVSFDVDPDEKEIEEDDQGFSSQLQGMFISIEGSSADEQQVLVFDDEDGERVFLRTSQILTLEAPLLCCEPKLWDSHVENSEDDEVESETISSLGSEAKSS